MENLGIHTDIYMTNLATSFKATNTVQKLKQAIYLSSNSPTIPLAIGLKKQKVETIESII